MENYILLLFRKQGTGLMYNSDMPREYIPEEEITFYSLLKTLEDKAGLSRRKSFRSPEKNFRNIRHLDILYIEKKQSQISSTNKTNIFIGKAKYARNAYLHILGNTVVFDCSDDEYGPIEFPLDLLKQKIKEHVL